jgi:hypothetical protein
VKFRTHLFQLLEILKGRSSAGVMLEGNHGEIVLCDRPVPDSRDMKDNVRALAEVAVPRAFLVLQLEDGPLRKKAAMI